MNFTVEKTGVAFRSFTAYAAGEKVGTALLHDSGEVQYIGVLPKFQRRGYATLLWNWLVENGEEPKHSACRTREGDAWVRKMGGDYPVKHATGCPGCG